MVKKGVRSIQKGLLAFLWLVAGGCDDDAQLYTLADLGGTSGCSALYPGLGSASYRLNGSPRSHACGGCTLAQDSTHGLGCFLGTPDGAWEVLLLTLPRSATSGQRFTEISHPMLGGALSLHLTSGKQKQVFAATRYTVVLEVLDLGVGRAQGSMALTLQNKTLGKTLLLTDGRFGATILYE